MRRQILNSVVAIGFVFLFAALSVSAQTSDRIVAHIPFDFYVAKHKFAAGDYTVTRVNPRQGQVILVISERDGKNNSIVTMTPLATNRRSEDVRTVMVFNRYGNDYYWSELRSSADSFRGRLPQSKAEQTLAVRLGKPERETVAIDSQRRK